jgi:prephenate dehydratase
LPSYAIPPEEIGQLYREVVMPLNKDVQVMYLLARLGGPNVAYLETESKVSKEAATVFAGIEEEEKDSLVSCNSLASCFAMVKANNVSRCCVCIEETPGAISHSLHQFLFENYQSLCITRELYIQESRFFEIAKTGMAASSQSGNDKTALSMGLTDVPGALSQVLAIFAQCQVNLLLISSSTVAGEGNCSNFFLEVDGHAKEEKVISTLEAVRSIAHYCHVLGSFLKLNKENGH